MRFSRHGASRCAARRIPNGYRVTFPRLHDKARLRLLIEISAAVPESGRLPSGSCIGTAFILQGLIAAGIDMLRNKIPLRHLIMSIACGLLAAQPVCAAPPAGRLLAAQCAQCHGTNGNGPGFENIAGESAGELYHELLEMKYRTRIESIMDRQARGYSDAQLLSIANYLARQPGSGD
jgi:cytochrome subunit of sulfide dehydrogenase